MKWWRRYRPKVHWWMWVGSLILNSLMAVMCAYVGSKYETDNMTRLTCTFIAFMILSYFFANYWRKWVENPKDYERLYTARLRRLGRRMGGGRGKKTKKEETKKK